jgi:tetratricopeptide (TPR) repeat protein
MLLTELGSAAMRGGEWESARAVLEEAMAAARRAGDRRSELRSMVELQFRRSFTEPEDAADEDRQVAETVIPELERLDDPLGLAKAWWLLSESHVIAGRWAARADALEQAIVHARRLPDDSQLQVLVALYAQALYYGPTPVAEAIVRCSELVADVPGSPTFEAGIGTTLAALSAMEGRFEDARERYARSVAVHQEFGLHFRRAVRTLAGAQIEALAGELEAAREELRTGYDMLEEMGERGTRSVLAGFLADILSLQGEDAEAERYADVARETAAENDVVSQVLWRRASARAAARRSDHARAGDLARDALRLAGETDFLDLRAGTLVALAEVLGRAGTDDEASSVLEEARELYRLKGNIAALHALAGARGAIP